MKYHSFIVEFVVKFGLITLDTWKGVIDIDRPLKNDAAHVFLVLYIDFVVISLYKKLLIICYTIYKCSRNV
jgi:hypothetical protein